MIIKNVLLALLLPLYALTAYSHKADNITKVKIVKKLFPSAFISAKVIR